MNLNEYQTAALSTAPDIPEHQVLAFDGLCIAGEAGELANYIKKILFHGYPRDDTKIVEELGDILWYIAHLTTFLRVPLEVVAQVNLAKLAKRYPNGFSQEASINREE